MALNVTVSKNWSDYEATSTSSFTVNTSSWDEIILNIETGKAFKKNDDVALVPTNAKIPFMLIGTVNNDDAALTGVLSVKATSCSSQIPSWDLVSATLNTNAVGTKTYTTYNGKSSLLASGDSVMYARRGALADRRGLATVTSYDNATGSLVLNISAVTGVSTAVSDWIFISAGTFSNWNVVPSPITSITLLNKAVLTMDKEPIYPIGSLVSLDRGRIVGSNPSTTTPWIIEMATRNTNSQRLIQAENNGEINFVSTARIEVATGTNSAGQTIDFSTVALSKIDWPAIEVETGSGTGVYKPWGVYMDNTVNRGFVSKNIFNRGLANGNFDAIATSAVTATISSPGVINWNSHGLKIGQRLRFSVTAGNLQITPGPPVVNVTMGADYYIVPRSFTPNSFMVAVNTHSTPINFTANTTTGLTVTTLQDFGSGDHGNVFLFNPVTRILRCGDGVCGNKIASGAKVRIPNIYFQAEHPRTPIMSAISSATAGNACTSVLGATGNILLLASGVVYINGEEFTGSYNGSTWTSATRNLTGTEAANHAQGDTFTNILSVTSQTNGRCYFDVASGGKVTLEGVAFGVGMIMLLTDTQTCSLKNIWVSGGCNFGSGGADVVADGIFSSPNPMIDVGGIIVTSILGNAYIKNLYAWTVSQTASTTAVQLASCQNVMQAEDFMGFVANKTTTAPVSINLNTNSMKSVVKNMKCIGGRLTVASSSRFEIDGILLSSESNAINSSNNATIVIVPTNCQFGVFRNISKITGGAAARSYIIQTDANCSDLVFHGITYDMDLQTAFIINPIGNKLIVANGTFGTPRDPSNTIGGGILTGTATGYEATFRNLIFTAAADTYLGDNGIGIVSRGLVEQCTGHSMLWTTSTFFSNYVDCGPFHTLLDNGVKDSGTLCAQFFQELTRDIYDLSGGAYLNNAGSVYLPTSGDYIILKSYHPIRTVTGFTGVVDPEDVNNANLTYEFELVGFEEAYTNTWTSLTTANLNTAIGAIANYSDLTGIKMRIKITATASNALNRVTQIRMFTTNNAARVLPIGATDYTISNLSADSVIGIFEGTTEVEYDNGLSGTSVEHLPYAYDGNFKTLSVKLRCYLDTWDDHDVIFNQYALSYVSKQAVDTNITELTKAIVAAYTILETVPKIYDYCKYWGTLRANLLIPMLCSKSGTSLNFGSYDIVIDNTASLPLTKVGNTITIKATSISGGSITTTGTITFAGTSETGTTLLSGSNGVSGLLTIQGLTSTAVYVKDNSGTQFDYVASVTGDYTKVIPFGSTGSWMAVTKRVGYKHAYYSFTASMGGNFITTPSMPEKLNPDGTAMYLGTSSALINIVYNGTTQANIDIGNGSADLQATFDESELSLLTNSGMIWLAGGKSDISQFNSAGGDYLFLSTGWRLRRASAGDVNATLNAFCIGADGTIVDSTNGDVQFLTSDSPTAIAQAVRNALAPELARIDISMSSISALSKTAIESSTILAKEATSNIILGLSV
jgi:hypothetical protein